MKRLLLGLVAVAALAACTDSTPTGTRSRAPDRVRPSVSTAETQDELNTKILAIIACWPKGQENDLTHRWEDIKKKLAEGVTRPKKHQEAIKKLFDTGKHVIKETRKIPEEELPCEGYVTREEAAAGLMESMVLYVFGGEPGGDNVTGVLKPDEPLDLFTPNRWAGLHFDSESTNEDRIIVVTQNNAFYDICDGPLLTELCQYPLFYTITAFPDNRLLKVAQIAICHPPENSERGPSSSNHENLRLAHTKPGNAADYTPGGSIRDTPASDENIEILPWDENMLLLTPADCAGPPEANYPPLEEESAGLLQRGLHLASAFVAQVGKFLTPRSAYAIDQGAGGSFLDFSPFNYVDICDPIEVAEPSCEAPTGGTGFLSDDD